MKSNLIKTCLIILLPLMFSTTFINAQNDRTDTRVDQIVRGAFVTQSFGTVANAAQDICYLDLRGWSKIDSVVVSVSAENETDLDTINFYIGNYTGQSGFVSDAVAGVLYQAITINIADAATDFEVLLTSDATVLTGVALRGANYIRAVIEAAAAGNDATDPNAYHINWHIFGTKE